VQVATMTSWLNPVGWMGPIFDKELRVASRRKRTYWLRTGYVGMMAIFLIPVWAEQLRYSSGSGLATLAASEIGIRISRILLTIQFISMQILSAFFLCTSIREEITRRTLGVLWTTPISGLQLVIGKLASKMLILIQLLSMSIPILSMLRLFGGIPWSMLISGLCLTLATMFMVAALSMLLSLYFRHALAVVAMAAALLGATWGPFPILVFFGWALWNSHSMMPGWLEFGIITSNPYFSFFDQLGMGTNSSLLICCMVQIGIGALLVWITAAVVRKRGLRSMDELPRREDFHPERYHPKAVFLFRPWFAHTLIKRWLGPGMIWKESISPLFHSRHRMFYMVLMAIGIGVVLWTLIVLTVYDMWKTIDVESQAWIVLLGFCLGVLLTAITSVTVITSEIEGQSWPILLTTPLSSARILGGKMYGVLRRSGWVWVALLFWGLISCWQKTLVWSVVLKWIPLFLISIWFVTSIGMYLAIRFKRAMPVTTIVLIILVVLWLVIPVILTPAQTIGRQRTFSASGNLFTDVFFNLRHNRYLGQLCGWVRWCNPLNCMAATLEDRSFFEGYTVRTITKITLGFYFLVGLLFFCGTLRRMRKRVFG
jgi:ABC-type transport system involved in multi-copper enzyme maturation permease subunit